MTTTEAFEDFYGNYQKPLVPDALAKNADGEYKHYFTRDALAIWNAALTQPSVNFAKNYHLEWCSANVKIAELTAKCEKMKEALIKTEHYMMVTYGQSVSFLDAALSTVKGE